MSTKVLVILSIVLCVLRLTHADDQPDGPKAQDCQAMCVSYLQRGYTCALENECFKRTPDEMRDLCYDNCNQVYRRCQGVCEIHYDVINATCQASCAGASMLDFHCDKECFLAELNKIFPNLPKPDVDVFEKVPLLGDDDDDDDGDDDSSEAESEVDESKRDDRSADSGSNSDDDDDDEEEEEDGDTVDDDIFGLWRKKRSDDGSRSEDSSPVEGEHWNDVFWFKKRDRSADSGSNSDDDDDDEEEEEEDTVDDDIFGLWRKKRSDDDSCSEDSSDEDEHRGHIFYLKKRSDEDSRSVERRGEDWNDIPFWYEKRQAN